MNKYTIPIDNYLKQLDSLVNYLNILTSQKNLIESEYTKQNSISPIHFEIQQIKLEHINKKRIQCNKEIQELYKKYNIENSKYYLFNNNNRINNI